MESSPNFDKPSAWTCTDEQLVICRAMYLMPFTIALAIYLYFSCLLETKVSYLAKDIHSNNKIKSYVLILFYQKLNLKYSSASFS